MWNMNLSNLPPAPPPTGIDKLGELAKSIVAKFPAGKDVPATEISIGLAEVRATVSFRVPIASLASFINEVGSRALCTFLGGNSQVRGVTFSPARRASKDPNDVQAVFGVVVSLDRNVTEARAAIEKAGLRLPTLFMDAAAGGRIYYASATPMSEAGLEQAGRELSLALEGERATVSDSRSMHVMPTAYTDSPKEGPQVTQHKAHLANAEPLNAEAEGVFAWPEVLLAELAGAVVSEAGSTDRRFDPLRSLPVTPGAVSFIRYRLRSWPPVRVEAVIRQWIRSCAEREARGLVSADDVRAILEERLHGVNGLPPMALYYDTGSARLTHDDPSGRALPVTATRGPSLSANATELKSTALHEPKIAANGRPTVRAGWVPDAASLLNKLIVGHPSVLAKLGVPAVTRYALPVAHVAESWVINPDSLHIEAVKVVQTLDDAEELDALEYFLALHREGRLPLSSENDVRLFVCLLANPLLRHIAPGLLGVYWFVGAPGAGKDFMAEMARAVWQACAAASTPVSFDISLAGDLERKRMLERGAGRVFARAKEAGKRKGMIEALIQFAGTDVLPARGLHKEEISIPNTFTYVAESAEDIPDRREISRRTVPIHVTFMEDSVSKGLLLAEATANARGIVKNLLRRVETEPPEWYRQQAETRSRPVVPVALARMFGATLPAIEGEDLAEVYESMLAFVESDAGKAHGLEQLAVMRARANRVSLEAMGDRLSMACDSGAFRSLCALASLSARAAEDAGDEEEATLHFEEVDILSAHAQGDDGGEDAVERKDDGELSHDVVRLVGFGGNLEKPGESEGSDLGVNEGEDGGGAPGTDGAQTDAGLEVLPDQLDVPSQRVGGRHLVRREDLGRDGGDVVAIVAVVRGSDPHDTEDFLDDLIADTSRHDDVDVKATVHEVERAGPERFVELHSAAGSLVAATDTDPADAWILTALQAHEDVHAPPLQPDHTAVVDVAQIGEKQRAGRDGGLVELRVVVFALRREVMLDREVVLERDDRVKLEGGGALRAGRGRPVRRELAKDLTARVRGLNIAEVLGQPGELVEPACVGLDGANRGDGAPADIRHEVGERHREAVVERGRREPVSRELQVVREDRRLRPWQAGHGEHRSLHERGNVDLALTRDRTPLARRRPQVVAVEQLVVLGEERHGKRGLRATRRLGGGTRLGRRLAHGPTIAHRARDVDRSRRDRRQAIDLTHDFLAPLNRTPMRSRRRRCPRIPSRRSSRTCSGGRARRDSSRPTRGGRWSSSTASTARPSTARWQRGSGTCRWRSTVAGSR